MNTIFLLILALLPGFILIHFILSMDRTEKEPLGLVIVIIFLGALSLVPAAILEVILRFLPIYSGGKFLNAITISFVQVAWVEELAKLSVVLLVAWNNKNFNEENDGIVYVGASALGFAMLENVFYVLSLGIVVGILRAITAMPLHCFTGVLMGYYVGLAKFSPTKKERRKNILKGFFLAYILHGTYDALLLTRTPAALLIFPMVIGLVIFGIKSLKKSRALSLARTDTAAEAAVDTITQQELLIYTNPKNQLWKIIISRTLLTISGLFWLLFFVGLIAQLEQFKSQILEAILGAIILSFLPIFIGVILEISYHRKKKIFRDIQDSRPIQEISPAAPTVTLPVSAEQSPPGQLGKIFISRALLTISGLFWALLILGFLAKIEEYASQWFQWLMTGLIITFIPIYMGVLLELCHRRKKKIFNNLKMSQPTQDISPEMLRISPPDQLWKAILSRTLLIISGIFWALLILGFSTGNEENAFHWAEVLMGGLMFTLIPIVTGVSLEVSYQGKLKEYWYTKLDASTIPTTVYAPKPPTVSDDDLHDYCRNLKEKRDKKRDW